MSGTDPSDGQDRVAAIALGLGFVGLYLSTLCRTVYWYDSAELVAAAVTLGNTHPPGYPVYTWFGRLFAALPMDPALALNAMSALAGAIAVSLAFLVQRELSIGRIASAVGAATFGAGAVFWRNAVVAEVYAPALATTTLILLLLLRGVRRGRRTLTFAGAFIAGVGLGVHMSIATLGLGFAWLAWLNGRDAKIMAGSFAASVIGGLVLLTIPLRAAMRPALNACDPASMGQFFWYVTGGAYRNWFGSDDLGNGVADLLRGLSSQVGWVGVAAAVLGAVILIRRQKPFAIGLLLMVVGNLGFFLTYRAHDAEVFLLPTTFVTCVCIGASVQLALERVSRAVPPTASRGAHGLTIVLALALPAALLWKNYAANDLSDFDEADAYLQEVVETLPEGATIITLTTPEEWQRYAVFGMYGQLVRGVRHDVRHQIGPDLRKLARDFDTQGAMYLYAPVELITHYFEVRPEGPLFRVTAPKAGASTKAPRRVRRGQRTCSTFTPYEVHDD